ncbi:MAG: phosphatidylserine/phosphatidylglycerophosphate/cardiolipin synthase family protein [Bacteroidales bacterium]
MIEDIESAEKYIYIQTFRIGKDVIGDRFRRALTKKAKQGVEIKILVDYWGAGSINSDYFKELIKFKGEVRFFQKIKYNTDIFTKSHKRNHRKLLLIDDKISYIGSSNLTGYNLNWRESVLRITSDITPVFAKLFKQDFKNFNKYNISTQSRNPTVKFKGFEIVRDAPSITFKKINNKFIRMIKSAEKQVIIETPYFLPGYFLRKALTDAAQRGVQVNVLLPNQSDVTLIDILRNKYLGPLSKKGVNFLFYQLNNLHAKLLLIDDKYFAIGSSNFDYRSFRYMYEIMLIGSDENIIEQISNHANRTQDDTRPFDYEKWKNRPLINKFFEWILLPFRHLL